MLDYKPCEKCAGKGEILLGVKENEVFQYDYYPCPDCHEDGYITQSFIESNKEDSLDGQ